MSALAECLEVPEQHVQVSTFHLLVCEKFAKGPISLAGKYCSRLTCNFVTQVLADTIAAVSEIQVAKDDQTAGQHQLNHVHV